MAKRNPEQAFIHRGLSVLSGHWITAHRQPIQEVVSRGRKTATFGLTAWMYDLGNHQIRWNDGEKYNPYATVEEWEMSGTIPIKEGLIGEITIFFKPKEYFGEYVIKLPDGLILESTEKAA